MLGVEKFNTIVVANAMNMPLLLTRESKESIAGAYVTANKVFGIE